MKSSLVALLAASVLAAQTPDHPISSLPYTPSLDIPSMDPSVNACDNFYQYACGGWIKKNPIPADQARWDVYAKLHQDNQLFLWGILEEAAKPAPDRSAAQRQIGDYFASCMDEPAVEKAGAAPLKPILDAISALKSKNELADFVVRQHLESNTAMMFGFSSSQDYADATRVIAFASAGGLGLPDRDYYVKTDPKSVETRAEVPGSRAGDVRAARRLAGRRSVECANRDGDRDRSGEGLLDARRSARSLQAVPQDVGEAARRADAFLRLEELSEDQRTGRHFAAQRHRARVLQGARNAAQVQEAFPIGRPTCAGTSRMRAPPIFLRISSAPTSSSTASICAASRNWRRAGSAASALSTAIWAKRWARCSSRRPSVRTSSSGPSP